jgi:hypothetical protein
METPQTIEHAAHRGIVAGILEQPYAEIRRFLRQISSFTREGAESENPTVIRLALELLQRSSADARSFFSPAVAH